MTIVKTRIHVAEDGTISGHVSERVPPGDYYAEIPLSQAPRPTRAEKLARMREIADRCARLPVIDARGPDEILGYDEHGLPH